MKKFTIAMLMVALISGVSLTAAASTPAGGSVSPLATPHGAYCLLTGSWGTSQGYFAGGLLGSIAGGWTIASGYGLLACLGAGGGIGIGTALLVA